MKSQQGQCCFCDPKPEILWFENEHSRAIWDGFPISKGHTLIVPNFHIPSFLDLDFETPVALWQLVGEVRNLLKEKYQPDGFNIGLNDGEAAGQIVMHAHIHVIPRWRGDVPDPREGIRWVITEKARYWGAE